MPAVYTIDLIEKRDKKKRMDRSIIKGWNVHYQTLAEVEEEARLKRQETEEETALNKKPAEEELNEEAEGAEQPEEQAYNRKTGAYSGNYGKAPVEDEAAKSQIHAILSEKKNAFDSAMSALKEEHHID